MNKTPVKSTKQPLTRDLPMTEKGLALYETVTEESIELAPSSALNHQVVLAILRREVKRQRRSNPDLRVMEIEVPSIPNYAPLEAGEPDPLTIPELLQIVAIEDLTERIE
jgi:hypothetical protein